MNVSVKPSDRSMRAKRAHWQAALLAMATLACSYATVGSAQDIVLDEIAIIVNNGVVLQSDIERESSFLQQRARLANQPLPAGSQIRERIVEKLIDREIQRQRARETGISVDPASINRAIERVAADNNMNTFQFREQLQGQGFDFQYYRETIEHELIVQRLVQREVEESLRVTEKEIDDYLESQSSSEPQIVRYRLQHILISAPSTAAPAEREQARQQARLVIRRFNEQEDFATIAREVSDGPRAASGGDLGWREKEELPLFVRDALPSLKTGDISEPIESSNGYHVVLLRNVQGLNDEVTGEDLRVRHIFIAANNDDSTRDSRRLLSATRERIIAGESFSDVAAEISQDPDSANNGGELPWLKSGQMPPQMEQVATGLPEARISQPFRTEFGWHIMEVLERRAGTGGNQRARNEATAVLRRQKFEREVENWQRRLRDEAFVEIVSANADQSASQ